MISILMYIGIVLSSCIQSVAVKLYSNNKDTNVLAFNTIKASVIFLVFLALSITSFNLNTETLIFASIYGLALGASMYAGYLALRLGPVSLTSLIVSFSLIIPCVYGIVRFDEAVTLIKTVGFILLAASIFLTNSNFDKSRPASKKWLIFVFVTLIANGVGASVQKEHQMRYPGLYLEEFMCISMLVATILFIVITLHKNKMQISKRTFGYGIASGVTNGAANFLTLAMAGMENATVLFPVVSAGTIIASVIAGKIIFGEKNSMLKYMAIILGIFAVIFLKL